MMLKCFKNPLFIVGLSFIILFLAASVIYTLYFYTPHQPEVYVYNDKADLVAVNPQHPSKKYLLGTDGVGNNMLYKIIDGAKYTIGLVIAISLLRMIVGLIFGVMLATFLKRIKGVLYHLSDAFHFAPAALIIYTVAAPVVVVYAWMFSPTTKFVVIISTLTLVAVPSLALLIADEMKRLKKEEYISSARLLGGGPLHIFKDHYMPHLKPRLIIIFTQHMIQIMLLFAHLGLLGLFLGGSYVETTNLDIITGTGVHVENTPISLGNEWGGLVASAKKDIIIHPWMMFGPIGAITLTILAMVAVVEGMKAALLDQRPIKKKQRKNRSSGVSPPATVFDFNKVPGESLH